MNVQFMGV